MFSGRNHAFRSPAKAGAHFSAPVTADGWVPAFAGKRHLSFVECAQ
jgi:hypothetical protein